MFISSSGNGWLAVTEPEQKTRTGNHDTHPTMRLGVFLKIIFLFCMDAVSWIENISRLPKVYRLPADSRAWRDHLSLLSLPVVRPTFSFMRLQGSSVPVTVYLLLWTLSCTAHLQGLWFATALSSIHVVPGARRWVRLCKYTMWAVKHWSLLYFSGSRTA